MRLVVDSSVVLKWFVDEPQRELAAALLDSEDALIAPDLVLCEVTNALWRKARKGEVTSLQVSEAIHEIGSILVLRPVTPEMTETAFFMLTFRANQLFFLLRNRLVQNGCGKLLMGDAWWNETFGYFCGFTRSMSIEIRLASFNKISSLNILTKATEEPDMHNSDLA